MQTRAPAAESDVEEVLHYGGIVVVAATGLDAACAAVDLVAVADVHHRDEALGRFICVLETADAAGQEEALDVIRRLPEVATAELVCHYVDRPEDDDAAGGEGS